MSKIIQLFLCLCFSLITLNTNIYAEEFFKNEEVELTKNTNDENTMIEKVQNEYILSEISNGSVKNFV